MIPMWMRDYAEIYCEDTSAGQPIHNTISGFSALKAIKQQTFAVNKEN